MKQELEEQFFEKAKTVAKQIDNGTYSKEWQYLTDDEIKEIVGSYGDGIGGYARELFDKIEAKIRSKNEQKASEK